MSKYKKLELKALAALGASQLPHPRAYKLKPDGFLRQYVVEVKIRRRIPSVIRRGMSQLRKYSEYFMGKPEILYLCDITDQENGFVILRKAEFLRLLEMSTD